VCPPHRETDRAPRPTGRAASLIASDADFVSPAGLNVAPLPQVVSSIAQADVAVIHQPCVDDNNSESFFMPRSGGPDLVSVGECVDYPIWITTHEIQHSYGFPHPDCGTIGSDPDYPNRKSILCRVSTADCTGIGSFRREPSAFSLQQEQQADR
jgi:hypothetical protein